MTMSTIWLRPQAALRHMSVIHAPQSFCDASSPEMYHDRTIFDKRKSNRRCRGW